MAEPVWCIWLHEVSRAPTLYKVFASQRAAHRFLREQGWRVAQRRTPVRYRQAHADLEAMLEGKVVGDPDAELCLDKWEVYGG
jgi:hypothetical protein